MKGSSPESDGEQAARLGRWKNVVRRTDYIGSWIFSPPCAPRENLHTDAIDVASLDPPSLCPGPGGDLAPIHYHSDWWQDPFPRIYAGRLIERLTKHT